MHILFPDPSQGVVYPAQLEAQLFLVRQVPRVASAAFAEEGTVGLHAGRGGLQQPLAPGENRRGCDLQDPDLPALPGNGPGHKNRSSFYAADAGAVGGPARDLRFDYFVFLQFFHAQYLIISDPF